MVIRIERGSRGRLTILRLSGRLQSEHVEQLKAEIEGSTARVVLDLEEVKLVELSQCSPFIREWIARERASRGKRL